MLRAVRLSATAACRRGVSYARGTVAVARAATASAAHHPRRLATTATTPPTPQVTTDSTPPPPPAMPAAATALVTRYACVVEYHGGAYHGWSPSLEREPERSVAGAIELAMSHLCEGRPVRIYGSGRTDRGVHAVGQVIHVDIDRGLHHNGLLAAAPFTAAKLHSGVNHYLRLLGHSSIQLLQVSVVPPSLLPTFHARHSAISRAYKYRVFNSPHACSTFERDRCAHERRPLDLPAMQAALRLIEGVHDFAVFQSAGCSSTSSVRDMNEARVDVEAAPRDWSRDEFEGGFAPTSLTFHFRSRSFLYHQIRNLMGTVLQVGRGAWTVDDVARFLSVDSQRALLDPQHRASYLQMRRDVGNFSAPPQGLFLRCITYPYALSGPKAFELPGAKQNQPSNREEAAS